MKKSSIQKWNYFVFSWNNWINDKVADYPLILNCVVETKIAGKVQNLPAIGGYFEPCVILMTLFLSIIKNLRSSFLIFTPKNSQFAETTESTSIASYLNLLFIQDKSNNITTKLYDKCDTLGFHIVNFPFMSSNIPSILLWCLSISALSLCLLLLRL